MLYYKSSRDADERVTLRLVKASTPVDTATVFPSFRCLPRRLPLPIYLRFLPYAHRNHALRLSSLTAAFRFFIGSCTCLFSYAILISVLYSSLIAFVYCTQASMATPFISARA